MANQKFRIKKQEKNNDSDAAKSEVFAASENTLERNYDKKAKANKSFTVPLNDYELELLRRLSEKEERSMRRVSRKLLVQMLESKID